VIESPLHRRSNRKKKKKKPPPPPLREHTVNMPRRRNGPQSFAEPQRALSIELSPFGPFAQGGAAQRSREASTVKTPGSMLNHTRQAKRAGNIDSDGAVREISSTN